jgi:integrase/recombinase XerD
MIFLSFFTGKPPEECWEYFDRHIAKIPLTENRAFVTKYILEKEEALKYSTLGSYLGHIKAFGIYLNQTPWLDATRDDVLFHIKGAEGRRGLPARMTTPRKPLGKYSKYQRMVMLRDFYKWLLDTEDTPDQFRRLPFRKPSLEEQAKGSDATLDQGEVIKLLSICVDEMDRCLVMVLLDSGFRSGEASALDFQDIEFDEYGALVQHHELRDGMKTGIRKVKVRVTFATRFIREWMEVHPRRSENNPPLFIARSHRNEGHRLSASAIWEHITRLSRRAKIRHIHPHMFRHTIATEAAKSGWGEEMMRLRFGWSKGSPMPSHYSHLDDEFDDYALRQAGLAPKPKAENEWRQECRACLAGNELDASFCVQCGVRLIGA